MGSFAINAFCVWVSMHIWDNLINITENKRSPLIPFASHSSSSLCLFLLQLHHISSISTISTAVRKKNQWKHSGKKSCGQKWPRCERCELKHTISANEKKSSRLKPFIKRIEYLLNDRSCTTTAKVPFRSRLKNARQKEYVSRINMIHTTKQRFRIG